MGFRCPKCKRNFGTDKKQFEQHMQEENVSYNNITLAAVNIRDIIKSSNMMNSVI